VLVVVIAGIGILFNLPFMSLGLEERDNKDNDGQSQIQKADLERDIDVSEDTAASSEIVKNKIEGSIQELSQGTEKSNVGITDSEQIGGLEDIQNELEQIAL